MKSAVSLLAKVAVAAIALFFLVAPAWSLLVKGPFSWHVRQPAAWQGGAEILGLAVIFYFSLGAQRKRAGILLGGLAAWFVARRHGVDLSIVLVYLYAEGLFGIGKLLARRVFGRPVARPAEILATVMFGILLWSLVIWAGSALGFGSLDVIRMLAICVLGLAVTCSPGPRLAVLGMRALPVDSWPGRVATALLGAMLIALFAKASVSLDYDSAWYGLQAEEVLVGDGSLYAAQGLASVAHYYPKFYEALLLPFSGLGSISLVFGFGIFSWLMLAFTVAAILREFNVSGVLRRCGVLLVATMPALANIAITAKGDAFSAWLLMLGVLGLVKYRKGGGAAWFWISASAVVLGLQARLSSIPYAGIILGLLAFSAAMQRRNGRLREVFLSRGLWCLGAALAVTVLVEARSVLLSGVVLVAPNSVVHLEQMLGMALKYPVGLLPPDEGLVRMPIADGLWGILFDPARYAHLIITWTANYWVFVPIAALMLGAAGGWVLARRNRGAWPLLVTGLSFFVVMFGYKLLIPAGDGNYFIVPITCMSLWGIVVADGLVESRKAILARWLLPFGLFAAAVSFVTGSWGPGTRGFDLEMRRLPFEYAQRARRGIQDAHLQGIARYFRGMPPGTRVVGIDGKNLDAELPPGWWLPVQYEPLQAYAWQQPSLVASPEAFQRYLVKAGIEYVILPRRPVGGGVEPVVRAAVAAMAATHAAEIVFQDDSYSLWKLKAGNTISVPLAGGGIADVDVDREQICAHPVNGVVAVRWSGASGSVAISVQSPSSDKASLWAEAGASGSLTTGPWMPIGGQLIFRRGRAGPEIGRVVVSPKCENR